MTFDFYSNEVLYYSGHSMKDWIFWCVLKNEESNNSGVPRGLEI